MFRFVARSCGRSRRGSPGQFVQSQPQHHHMVIMVTTAIMVIMTMAATTVVTSVKPPRISAQRGKTSVTPSRISRAEISSAACRNMPKPNSTWLTATATSTAATSDSRSSGATTRRSCLRSGLRAGNERSIAAPDQGRIFRRKDSNTAPQASARRVFSSNFVTLKPGDERC